MQRILISRERGYRADEIPGFAPKTVRTKVVPGPDECPADEMTISSTRYESVIPERRVLCEASDTSNLPIAALTATALARLRRRRYNARYPLGRRSVD
jgi:hypothetical protein